MSASTLDLAASEVLRQYPVSDSSFSLKALGNRGGFSGARLWRAESSHQFLCLKGWPPNDPTPARLGWIHEMMQHARNNGCLLVPAVYLNRTNRTIVKHSARLWDLTSWMPGQADFHAQPNIGRMEAACTALGQLHGIWSNVNPDKGTCPGVTRRLTRAREWSTLLSLGWQPSLNQVGDPHLRQLSLEARGLLEYWLPALEHSLSPWTHQSLLLQPCLCDIWHDHVLFDGDSVSGIIDYGATKIDHVAVDLARLLGSMAGDDVTLRTTGIAAYNRIRPLTCEEEALVTVLDATGTLLSLATWLRWIYLEKQPFEDSGRVVQRLQVLVTRVGAWKHFPSSA